MMSSRNIKVSFICAVWNEINRAPVELDKLVSTLRSNKLLDTSEIIIIDNLSTDGTREWAKRQNQEFIKVILNSKNIGKGGSIKKGILESKASIGVIYDLDAEYVAIDAIEGVEVLKASNSAIVLASRTLDGRADYVYLQNYLGVRLITELINFLYNKRLSDTATGLKILDLSFYKSERIIFNGFNVDFELVCLALNKNKLVKEFNGQYYPRSKSEGKKINAIRDGLYSVLAILRSARKINKDKSLIRNMLYYIFQQSAFKYFRVGFISTFLDVSIFALAVNSLNLSISTSNFIAFPIAFLFNYLFKIESVFCKNSRFDSNNEFYLIFIASLIGLILNTSIIIILDKLILTPVFAKIIAILPTFIWNYFVRRFYIYRKIR